jgi:hypothetical protein
MKSLCIQLWAGVTLLGLSGFSPVRASLIASPTTIYLAGLTAAGMGACEYLLRSRRPALAVVVNHSRN